MKNPGQAGRSRTTGWAAAVVALAATFVLAPSAARAACVGDCNGDNQVTVNELIQMVNIALGSAAVTTCMAGDANNDGEITVNEIVAGVNNALNDSCPTTTLGVCGDGIKNGTEECDPGSVCIGGTNAGTACTKEADCQGDGVCDTFGQQGPPGTVPRKACSSDSECGGAKCIHCKRFGGNGCAVNCTIETESTVNLVPGELSGSELTPGTSGALVYSESLTIPLTLSGTNTLLSGKLGTDQLGTPGLVPVAQKAAGIHIDRIPVASLACACVRGSVFKTCGGTQYEADGVTPSPNCTLPLCSVTKTMPCHADGDCPATETCVLDACAAAAAAGGKPVKPCTELNGPGNAGEGVIGCGSAGLPSVNYTIVQDMGGTTGIRGQAIYTPGAGGGAGSQILASASAIGTLVGVCTGDPSTTPAYGPDGEYCTDDDPFSARGVPSVTTLVTGTASAEVKNINGEDGTDIGPYSTTGNAIGCDKIAAGMLTGASQAGAFTSHTQPPLNDIAVTNVFVAQ